ncbi:MAG: FeoA family protein [Candidatus Bathyarchaeia archaeon]
MQEAGETSEKEIVSLLSLDEGERGIFVRAIGGYGLVRRLADMGLTPGAEVKIVRKCVFGGPVEIEVRGVTIAIGRGIAARIMIKPTKAGTRD